MKNILKYIVVFALLCGSLNAIGQNFSYNNIPALTIADFKGNAPDQSSISVAHTTCSVLYDVENTKLVAGGGVMVKYKLQAIMRKERSWIDKRLLNDKKRLSQILEHERGHVVIANILAKKLEEKMSKVYYGNYIIEAKKIFQKIFDEFKLFEVKYDDETNHSLNQAKQKEWNIKLKKLLSN